jgi:3-hydroxyisobutyrate dehydrogenase-like beta-hydroxyacid dehydrogenase
LTGASVVLTGGVGAGNVTKLANQIIVVTLLQCRKRSFSLIDAA